MKSRSVKCVYVYIIWYVCIIGIVPHEEPERVSAHGDKHTLWACNAVATGSRNEKTRTSSWAPRQIPQQARYAFMCEEEGLMLCICEREPSRYGVATVSRVDKNIGLFCRISSLLYGSFAKETCNFIDSTNQSHPIAAHLCNHHPDAHVHTRTHTHTRICTCTNTRTIKRRKQAVEHLARSRKMPASNVDIDSAIYVYMYVYMNIYYVYICTYIYVYICIYIYIYIYMYAYMYLYTYALSQKIKEMDIGNTTVLVCIYDGMERILIDINLYTPLITFWKWAHWIMAGLCQMAKIYLCKYVYKHKYMYICTYTYIYIHIYIHVHIYIYI